MLPAKGLSASLVQDPTQDPKVNDFFTTLSGHTRSANAFSFKTKRLSSALPMTILDSVHEDGAKLIQLEDSQIANLHMAFPGVRIVPEVFFNKAVIPRQSIIVRPKPLGRRSAKTKAFEADFQVNDEVGEPIAGVEVVAFSNFSQGIGAKGITNARGKVKLKFESKLTKVQRVYLYPKHTFWPSLKKNLSIVGVAISISIKKIAVPYPDAVRHFYGQFATPPLGKKFKVAVIDSGVGKHSAINLKGGECTVEGEQAADLHDYDGHGTHVAGIVSSFGKDTIEIYSYRVFPKNGGGASNYSIVKAIDRAVLEGCTLINMSLGGGSQDDAIKDAIADAYSKGVVCFVATGNDDRSPVSFPANYSLSVAVGAMGRKGTFPTGAEANDSIKSPFGNDKNNFVASFSNIGREVDLIAPGVGIVSCAPAAVAGVNLWAVMSGTSMACPAATGAAANLLLHEGIIAFGPPSSIRSNNIIKFLSQRMRSMGFGSLFEGKGMIL
jgi:subtilisin